MAYSSTNPRSEGAILDHLQQENPYRLTSDELRLRRGATDQEIAAFRDRCSRFTRSGRRSEVPVFYCYRLIRSGNSIDVQPVSLTVAQICHDPFILPYQLSRGDLRLLKSTKYTKGDRFTLEQRKHLLRGLESLYNELAASKGSFMSFYKLTRDDWIDDLGRYYRNVSITPEFYCPNLNFGRGEYTITRGSTRIRLAAYVWTGLAGLSPEVKAKILVSKNIDFHHVDENLWDIRPCRVMPIPTFVHRWVHSNPYPIDTYLDFFKE